MPYGLAPAEQTTVPMITWLGRNNVLQSGNGTPCDDAAATAVSHDNLFHTELGLLAISTAEYRDDLDIFSACRNDTRIAGHQLAASDTSAQSTSR
jgi:lipid A ethanolaminephosphotransferase